MSSERRPRLCVAMCCDFFFPRLGGVEMHMWSLSQCLLRRGHKVIVLTHAVPGPRSSSDGAKTPSQRAGVRYMTHGLKVYYLPVTPVVDNVTYPTFVNHLALFRAICVREQVQVVHGHQATSTFMHECLLQAKALGLGVKTVYTDHSLFGFADAASVHLNKVMKFSMSTVDAAIAVSHTCRENLVLRASLRPDRVATIPNAVDATKFTPPVPAAARLGPDDPITVVIISRLVYRKGIDLVARAIPIVCAHEPRVRFLIGGDGAKRLLLEEMREKYRLHDRVTLYGAVPHSQVRDVLCQGHIFLNSSLTESFCIAILEAAACGLFVVSTRVGGVPEVLPPDMVQFAADITPEALAEAVLAAVPKLEGVDRQEFHDRVGEMYNWDAVAVRTEKVYEKVCALPDSSLLHRLQLYHGIGLVAGLLACVIAAVLHVYVVFLEWWQPADDIERALEWTPTFRQSDGDESGQVDADE
ncbi:phosphatidylinositol glycan, class A [Phytophthora cinnamomi]|uniref:phosphatidylinositol glycan, class A n=1 Tax=Phytophthora cinnamomi TaxID=4785 RepID=UPI00355A2213|nr:phosphatidylinositol glycan, class A [Phytophthora cinnamomi]